MPETLAQNRSWVRSFNPRLVSVAAPARVRHTWLTRLDASVIFLGEVLDGIEILGDDATTDTTRVDGQIVEIECYNQKVWTPGTTAQESFGHNQRIIRYADVLLMAAEAANENGSPNVALNYLNQVRARARAGNTDILPDITATDQATLRLLIEDERNYELAFEGLRYWDLVRTDRASTILGIRSASCTRRPQS